MNTLFKRSLIFISLFLFSAASHAGKAEIYTSFLSKAGAGGYDVVAYFTDSKPVKGDKKLKTKYKNAQWYFSTAGNLELFKENPDKYLPQYGGYCAWAVAEGNLYAGDPLQWTVHNDKLYLNYDADVQKKWLVDKEKFIVEGDMKWPGILN